MFAFISAESVMTLPALSTLDWALLAVLGASVLLGLVRGFVTEVMALAGWVVAWLAARVFAAEVAGWLPTDVPADARPLGAAALVFVGALIVWSLLARLLSHLVSATPLALADRLLGAGFGALRGGLLLLLATAALLWTRAPCQPWWQASRGAQWCTQALRAVQAWLPSQGLDISFMGSSSCAASSV